jgi:hypothetical protein
MAPVYITTVGDPPRWLRDINLSTKAGTNFADKRRSLDGNSSLADSGHWVCFCLYTWNHVLGLYRESSIICGTGGWKLTMVLLGTITLELVSFCAYALFPALLSCLNASWKPWSVRELSTDFNSTSISPVVPKWRSFTILFNRENRETYSGWKATAMLLLLKNSPMINEVWDYVLSWWNSQFLSPKSGA